MRKVSSYLVNNAGPNLENRQKLHKEFLKNTGFTEYEITGRSLMKFFCQSSASDSEVKRVLQAVFGYDRGRLRGWTGSTGPFDHASLWGKHGIPMALIGHPYQLDSSDEQELDLIRSLGMKVAIDKNSWYGFGSIRVVVEPAYANDTISSLKLTPNPS